MHYIAQWIPSRPFPLIKLRRLILPRPLSECLEIAARMDHPRRGQEGLVLGPPRVGDGRDVSGAHERLAEGVDAVVHVEEAREGLGAVDVVVEDGEAEPVLSLLGERAWWSWSWGKPGTYETVQLVEDVEDDDVVVRVVWYKTRTIHESRGFGHWDLVNADYILD